ncbi:MAG: histidine kinase, partial [Actinomycetota bacterium]
FANRLVYGKRATPYEVMSDLSRAMAATISADDLLPRMAEAVGHGVRAAQTRIKVALPEGVDMQALYPSDASEQELEHILSVTHLGDTVGEIAVTTRSGDSLGAADHRLLADFAAQAGLAFHNIRLAAELEAQVAEVTLQAQELTRSSERIIAAQNEERRRLERDIHSGPQEHLNAMRSKIVEVEEALGLDIDRAIETLGDLASHSRKTLEMLRDLARGIFPQLLSDKGLIFALEAQAAKSSVQVEVRASLDLNAVRFDPKVEAAVYFCCIEATSEALGPSTISIHFDGENLQFVVESELALTVDFQNMSDRIEALGGTLEMDRDLTGRVPALVLTSA